MLKFNQNLQTMLNRSARLAFVANLGIYSGTAFSTVKPNIGKSVDFVTDSIKFQSSLELPLTVNDKTISIPEKQLFQRLEKSDTDQRIEPLQLTYQGKDESIFDLAAKLAKPNKVLALANYLKESFVHGEELPGTDLRIVSLDKQSFNLIDISAFEALFSKTHHSVFLNSKIFQNDPAAKDRLLSQLVPFLSPAELNNVRSKIVKHNALSLDSDLLPSFARKRVGTHTIFRGPNCFHAALSFQSPKLAMNETTNVRIEPGYHRDMINYDELWRSLQLSFYEIDPNHTKLQYGDMIVFFETKSSKPGQMDFKTLRHAATYLLGGYVFAKGSKSANSPYIVRTLAEEWETWTKYTEKLGAKVFRRSLKNVTTHLPADPTDWVY